jgi:hypothetical protein
LEEFPTEFCVKSETELFNDPILYNDTRGILQRMYLVTLNNMACRNNLYKKKDHLEYMREARDLLQSTCEPVLPDSVEIYGTFASSIAAITKHTDWNLCEGDKKRTCEENLLKFGGEPAKMDKFHQAYDEAMRAAGYYYDSEYGTYVSETDNEKPSNNIPVALIAGITVAGIAVIAAVVGLSIYRYRKRLQFTVDGGEKL